MLAAALMLATVMTVDGTMAPAPKDVDAKAREVQRVLDEARRDFEERHAELGLLGAAPLPGKEAVSAAPAKPARASDESRIPASRPFHGRARSASPR